MRSNCRVPPRVGADASLACRLNGQYIGVQHVCFYSAPLRSGTPRVGNRGTSHSDCQTAQHTPSHYERFLAGFVLVLTVGSCMLCSTPSPTPMLVMPSSFHSPGSASSGKTISSTALASTSSGFADFDLLLPVPFFFLLASHSAFLFCAAILFSRAASMAACRAETTGAEAAEAGAGAGAGAAGAGAGAGGGGGGGGSAGAGAAGAEDADASGAAAATSSTSSTTTRQRRRRCFAIRCRPGFRRSLRIALPRLAATLCAGCYTTCVHRVHPGLLAGLWTRARAPHRRCSRVRRQVPVRVQV